MDCGRSVVRPIGPSSRVIWQLRFDLGELVPYMTLARLPRKTLKRFV